MLFTIKYEWNGVQGERFERANTEEDALRQFDANWITYGNDPIPSECRWITQRWTEK